ncbi:MAX dimerization protein MGA a isoform X2 [Denticeps clupeoides]|uniref:MAX dimerization protein MGA a isoform X2 n=1 Tax=Denticeps clupeoides TaxID=299321 RepID=UPI0010A4EF6E|nr:MAX gene-associated protein-like isoform X2 [Denticeps clupeoides]
MATQKKQAIMVLQEEGATAPVVAPATATYPAFFVVINPGQASEGGQGQNDLLTSKGLEISVNSPVGIRATGSHPVTSTVPPEANSSQHAELLPPERTCKGISVTLDNNNMWNEFFRCTTEMILTKQGRRMFPYCRFRLSGMEPFQNYMLVMDITPMDNFRYKWTDRHWEPNGKAERHIPGRMFVHPDSPSSGHRWMQNPISFYKLKLTNNPLDQEGHIILHSMQRYLPRLHVVPADMLTDMSQLDGPDVVTFSFPQTEFFAVTAYQNLSITQLKIDYNPFAKGFREDATNLRTLPRLGCLSAEREKPNKEQHGAVGGTRSSVERGLQALFAKKGGFDVKPPGDRFQSDNKTDKSAVKRRPGTISELFQDGPLKMKKASKETVIVHETESAGDTNLEVASSKTSYKDIERGHEKVGKNPGIGGQLSEDSHTEAVVPVSIEDKQASLMQTTPTPDNCDLKAAAVSSENDIRPQNKDASTKHAEPATLPLLALFLQQLKAKTKPFVKSKPKPDSMSCTPDSVQASNPSPPVSGTLPQLPEKSPACCVENTPSCVLSTDCASKTQSLEPYAASSETCVASSHLSTADINSPPTCTELSLKARSDSSTLQPNSTVNLSTNSAPFSPCTFPDSEILRTNHPDVLSQSTSFHDLSIRSPSPLSDAEPLEPIGINLDAPVSNEGDERAPQSRCQQRPGSQSGGSKRSMKCKKRRKTDRHDELQAVGGLTDVKMQPNLEDVEGQLFVSFTSKEALVVHLGDDVREEETLPPQKSEQAAEIPESIQERISECEKSLLQDLKVMKHKQVIHPVLQEVGLKLNLLDISLEIDLQYLGVQLPIPPFVEGSGPVPFVSRTGKTTDFTKIKGWREKFVAPESSKPSQSEGSSDSGLKNRSAFCSDMLDEYLALEGKLIDERAASLSCTSIPTVAYQMPTKSTSYVRTLDSVLKKQTPTEPAPPPSSCTALASPRKIPKTFRELKEIQKPRHSRLKKLNKSSTAEGATSPAQCPKSGKLSSALAVTPTAAVPHRRKKAAHTSDTPTLPAPKLDEPRRLERVNEDRKSDQPGAARSTELSVGMSKRLVKLMEVEEGAVWEGRERPFITEERAALALASFATSQDEIKHNVASLSVLKRRAPPCLSAHCRLGCVCASLVHERHHSHCGKPECMLGCSCLRHKVVLVKNLTVLEKVEDEEDPGPPESVALDATSSSVKRQKRSQKAYVLTDHDGKPEPVTRVRNLWNRNEDEDDPELLLAPPPVYLSYARPMQYNTEMEDGKFKKEDTMTCARVRPMFTGNSRRKEDDTCLESGDSAEDVEPGQCVSGPSKRLEVISDCSWEQPTDKNCVLRVLCEHMAQDRLKSPFWVGKYRIQPISQLVSQEEQGPCVNYKVCISKPQISLLKHKLQPKESQTEPPEQRTEQETENTTKKTKVKLKSALQPESGLPFMCGVSQAGLLIAEKMSGDLSKPPVTLNGKSYSQAKLQLGQMGALHPANRLAAYITGRLRSTTSQAASNTQKECPSATTSTSTVSVVKINPRPADGTSSTKTVKVVPNQKMVVYSLPVSKGGQPVSTSTPSRILFQPVRTPTGNTLFRNPSGQLVHLVPLSQLRAINPNLVLQDNTYVQIPKVDGSGSSTVPILSTLSLALKKASETSLSPAAAATTTTTGISAIITSPVKSSLSTPAATDMGTTEVNSTVNSPSQASRTVARPVTSDIIQAILNAAPRLTSLGASQVPQSSICAGGKPALATPGNGTSTTSESSNTSGHLSAENVVSSDHSYTSAQKGEQNSEPGAPVDNEVSTSSDSVQNPRTKPKAASRHTSELFEEMFDLAPLSSEGSEDEMESQNSDMSEESEDSVFIISDSEDEDRGGNEENTSVDVETVDEWTVHNTKVPKENILKRESRSLTEHSIQERKRRVQMRQCFDQLRKAVKLNNPRSSKIKIIQAATKTIRSLHFDANCLSIEMEMQTKLQAAYLNKITLASGKSVEMIKKKLNEIIKMDKQLQTRRKLLKKPKAARKPPAPIPAPPHPPLSVPVSSPAPRKAQITVQSPPVQKSPQPCPVVVEESHRTFPINLSRRTEQPPMPTGSAGHPYAKPGVASVTITIPAVSQPVQVSMPLMQNDARLQNQEPANVTIPTILNVKSLVSPEKNPVTVNTHKTQPLHECPATSTPTVPVPEAKQVEEVKALEEPLPYLRTSKKESLAEPTAVDSCQEKEKDADDEGECDDPLMSLLDEICNLNDQLSNDSSLLSVTPSKLGESLAGIDQDDDHSLSPLLFSLNDDQLQTPTSFPRGDLIKPPAPTPAPVRVNCGPALWTKMMPNGHSNPNPTAEVKVDALAPPPLLQMKAGTLAMISDSNGWSKESEVSWRPMPKLAPLGLKTAAQTNVKPGSNSSS